MRLGLVAAASAAALISVTTADADDPSAGPGSSPQGSPPSLDRPPGWYRKPTPEQIHAAWPTKAFQAGVGGSAKLDCRVNIHGVLEDCQVLSETPAGQNFGMAALLLTPQLLFTPAIVAGESAPSRVRFPINFDYEGPPSRDGGPAVGFAKIINHPLWASAPGFADIGAVYPKDGRGAAGYVAFRCEIKKTGDPRNCDVTREEPKGKGFESAARKLIHLFRADMTPEMLALRETLQVNLPIRLIDPGSPEFVNRQMGEPLWTTRLDPNRIQKLFPAAAAALGVRTGQGVAGCTVTAQGALTDCTSLPATPDGFGFSEAAVQVAQVMKMNPWTQDGGPVDGVRVRLPIRFNLAEPPAPPPQTPNKP